MAGLGAEYRGPSIFGLLGVPEDQRVTADRMDELAGALAKHLSLSPSSQAANPPHRVWLPTYRTGGPLDTVLEEVRRRRPGVVVERLQLSYATDDDNVYFLSDDQHADCIQVDTGPDGNPPFVINRPSGTRRRSRPTLPTAA
jgi:hypothetical protein